MVYKLRV